MLLRTSIRLIFSKVNIKVSDSDLFCVLLKLLPNTFFIFGRKQKLQITLLDDFKKLCFSPCFLKSEATKSSKGEAIIMFEGALFVHIVRNTYTKKILKGKLFRYFPFLISYDL